MIRKVLTGGYVAAILAAGCGDAPLPQDMCSWLADENNCLQRFGADVGTQCAGAAGASVGTFLTRDKLDICIKDKGGQVVFDPPLDLSTFPLEQASFKLLDSQGVACGSGSYSGSHAYSITIEPQPAGVDGDPLTGGTFTIAATPGTTATYDVTCPGGVETHNFNSLILSKCPSRIPFQPTAILESSPGSPNNAGFVRFRVEYPPTNIDAAGAAPTLVEYFDCAIPAPPPPCQDGVKNGSETAIDCGGSCVAKGFKCAAGQACLENGPSGDCASGVCAVDPMTGTMKCQ